MSNTNEPAFPLRLTQAQRQIVADLVPEHAHRLSLTEPNQRTPKFTMNELRHILAQSRRAFSKAKTGAKKTSMRHVIDLTSKAVRKHQEGSNVRIPASERLYQFKITLKEIEPPIWRRIQVKDCSLDELHEHIQTAMGWTNSHLHQFEIKGERYGDPELLLEDYGDDQEVINSLETKISQIVPKNGKQFRFGYEYDFGDDWIHEVLFEGCPKAEKGTRYPVCLEGKRACPPEDVGGPYGYQEFLEALADPKHEQHEEFMEWRGRFTPEKFDAKAATKAMQKGLPNWREIE